MASVVVVGRLTHARSNVNGRPIDDGRRCDVLVALPGRRMGQQAIAQIYTVSQKWGTHIMPHYCRRCNGRISDLPEPEPKYSVQP